MLCKTSSLISEENTGAQLNNGNTSCFQPDVDVVMNTEGMI